MLGQATSAFLLLGVALIAGAVGHAVFRRFRISDILVLLVIGFVLGPLTGLLDASWLKPAMPILAPIGLVIILFEGGLCLRWEDLRAHGWGAVGFSMLSWGAGALALWFACVHVLGFAPHLALLFSVAVCATGIVAVIPILAHLNPAPKARVWLTLETGLGDLLSAVAVTGLATLYLTGGTAWSFGGELAVRVLAGAAVGIVGGLLLARVLHRLPTPAHAYPLTLAALLGAYALSEFVGGSGLLSALVLGVIVGNAAILTSLRRLPALASLAAPAREQQGMVIFLLRSIFFVYLGMSVGGELLAWSQGLAALLLAGALLVARIAVVAITHRGDRRTGLLLGGMMPRGLATAVLASIPAAMGVPGSEGFLAAAILVIVGSDIATTLGLFLYESRRPRAPLPAAAAVASVE